jgi:hypothetical protein
MVAANDGKPARAQGSHRSERTSRSLARDAVSQRRIAMVVAEYATAAAQQLVRIRPNQSAAYGSRARPAKPESRSPENYTPVYRFVPGGHSMSPSCYAPLSPRTSLIPPFQGYAQQPLLLSRHRDPHPRPAQARRSPAPFVQRLPGGKQLEQRPPWHRLLHQAISLLAQQSLAARKLKIGRHLRPQARAEDSLYRRSSFRKDTPEHHRPGGVVRLRW